MFETQDNKKLCRVASELSLSSQESFPSDAFSREDETADSLFYRQERFVQHLDSLALSTVKDIIGRLVVEESPVILDLMASWDSHLPESLNTSRVIGLGLNSIELARNHKLTGILIQDINAEPTLPFKDCVFDVVLNVVSVDYLVRPFEVFQEVCRVLKPHGLFLVIFSNRMFPQKAVWIWQQSTEPERVLLVKRFFESSGQFEAPSVFVSSGLPRPEDDKYAHLGIPSDPIYAVYAELKSNESRRISVRPDINAVWEVGSEHVPPKKSTTEKDTFLCVHCGQRMNKWAVPNSPFSTWDTEYLYICFNDSCPYLVRGWQVMADQGNQGMSYRYVYDPERKSSINLPVMSLHALKDGIVE